MPENPAKVKTAGVRAERMAATCSSHESSSVVFYFLFYRALFLDAATRATSRARPSISQVPNARGSHDGENGRRASGVRSARRRRRRALRASPPLLSSIFYSTGLFFRRRDSGNVGRGNPFPQVPNARGPREGENGRRARGAQGGDGLFARVLLCCLLFLFCRALLSTPRLARPTSGAAIHFRKFRVPGDPAKGKTAGVRAERRAATCSSHESLTRNSPCSTSPELSKPGWPSTQILLEKLRLLALSLSGPRPPPPNGAGRP